MKRLIVCLMIYGTLFLPLMLLGQEPEEEQKTEGEGVPYVLPAVEVRVAPEEDQSKSTTVLTEKAMHGHHAANMNDYFLAGIPGVSTSRRSNFGFSGPGAGFWIRGLTGTRVAVFVDGVPSQVNSHGHPRSDQYSPDMIQRIQLIKGPSAVLHGASAVGGVVEVFTRRPERGFSGYAQGQLGELDTRQLEGDVGYGWETGNALFSATERASDAQVLGEGFDLRNLNFKINQEIATDWTAGFRFNNTKEEPSDRFGSDPAEVLFRFTEDLTTYVASLDRQTNASKTMVALQFNELDTGSFRESQVQGRFMESERVEDEQGIYARHTWLRGGENTLSFGADAVRTTDENPKGAEKLDESFFSPYVHASQALGPRTTLEGGARLTTSGDFDTDISPEIGITGSITPSVALRARGGKAFRVPRITEINTAIVNEDLEPEDFWHAEAGMNAAVREQLMFDFAVWYMEGDNLIQRVGEGATQTSVNTGKFSHQGLETSVNISVLPELAFLVGGAIVEVDEDTRFVPQKTLDLGADFHPGNFRATLIARYAADNSTPQLDDYFVGDLRFSYLVVYGIELLLDVVNFTDEEYATLTAGPNNIPLEQVPRTFLGGVRYVWGPR